jgi:hypothetical protein
MGEKACFMYFFNMGKGCRWLYGASCITSTSQQLMEFMDVIGIIICGF